VKAMEQRREHVCIHLGMRCILCVNNIHTLVAL
jgi:hypothetical protein